MILFVSGRTDIVAYYTNWFMNRYKEGFLDVRNPFNPKLVSRINFQDVDMIFFCTKNPKPIIPFLKEIDKPILFHVTLTPYHKDIEPGVPPKNEVIKSIKELSNIIGKYNLVIRYDPIFISDRYTLDYHVKAFDKMCELLDGYTNKIIVSFIDDYKNVRENKKIINDRPFTKNDYKTIGTKFSQSAKEHKMTVQTCFEDCNLVEYGFIKGECLSSELAFFMTGKKYPKWKARKEKKCNCVEMVDVGSYNSCPAHCYYCYASYDQKNIVNNYKKHNPTSSLLIGELEEDDIIKVRKP